MYLVQSLCDDIAFDRTSETVSDSGPTNVAQSARDHSSTMSTKTYLETKHAMLRYFLHCDYFPGCYTLVTDLFFKLCNLKIFELHYA